MAFKKTIKDEFDKNTIDIARVTRVTGGGKRFRFRATVAVGNKKGKVGVGMAKALDVSQAIDKATRQAKKNVFIVPLSQGGIPHDVEFKFKSARVLLKPAKIGRGVIAGGSMRAVLSLAGIESVVGKILSRTKNKLNIAQATIGALKQLKVKQVYASAPTPAEDKAEE